MYYYDDVYGSNGPSADVHGGGGKFSAAKRQQRKAAAAKTGARAAARKTAAAKAADAKTPARRATKSNRRSGAEKRARAKAAAAAAKVASKSPKKAAAPTPKKDRNLTPMHPQCGRLSRAKRETKERRGQRRRSQHLGRRCDQRQAFLEKNAPLLEAAEAEKSENKKLSPETNVLVMRVKRTAARLGREQSKLRAFVKQKYGFKGVDTIRTASGYTIHRSDVARDQTLKKKDRTLREKHGRFYVNKRRLTNAKFMAWREAVREVVDQRGYQKHPTKGGALLAKKDGDEHERRHWQEIHDVYMKLVDGKRIASQVEQYNDDVYAHNDQLLTRSEDNAQEAKEAKEKAKRDAEADKEAKAKAKADKKAKKAARASAKKEKAAKAKERRAASKKSQRESAKKKKRASGKKSRRASDADVEKSNKYLADKRAGTGAGAGGV
jgi:hypothetical protein